MECAVFHGEKRLQATRRAAVAVGVGAVLALGGCYTGNNPQEYDAQAKTNFLNACTEDVQTEKATTTVVELAPKDDCVCIYEQISDVKGEFYISFDDLTAWEVEQANADPDDMPPPPKRLVAATQFCTNPQVGPGLG